MGKNLLNDDNADILLKVRSKAAQAKDPKKIVYPICSVGNFYNVTEILFKALPLALVA